MAAFQHTLLAAEPAQRRGEKQGVRSVKVEGREGQGVRVVIVHVSDTHGQEQEVLVPEGDLFIHTGTYIKQLNSMTIIS